MCCWLRCVLCGCRLWPCRCDRLAPALWAVLVPAVCWLAPVALWLCPCLEAVPLPCGLCWWRLSARALPGAMWGVYIKLLGDYTGRVKPLPARLAVSLAACFRPLPGAVPEAAAGPVMGRRSCRLPVHLWAAPLVLLSVLASCLPVCWSRPPPRTAPRKTPEKTRRIFPACLPDLSRRRSRSRTRPGSTSPAGPLQAGRRTGKNPVGKFRRDILRARSKSCFLVY